MRFNKSLNKSVKTYLNEFKEESPLIYKNGKLRVYQTFVGKNGDQCDVSFNNSNEIALIADRIYHREKLTQTEFLNSLKYSEQLNELRNNLIEFATNEFPEEIK